jgi:hypothetical protein
MLLHFQNRKNSQFAYLIQLVRNDMYVNEHERLSNFTLRPKLKGTACSKKGYVGK